MTPLMKLADLSGIEAEFRDARGDMRKTSEATARALLAAMGLAADDDNAAAASLHAVESAAWNIKLPPVHVAYTGRESPVSLSLPAETGTLAWTIQLEDGATRSGNAAFADLTPIARRHAGGGTLERRALALPADLPWGYHRLSVTPGDAHTMLIVTPGQCWLPPRLAEGGAMWGMSAQLYLLRSAQNWGIGDYGDLKHLVAMLASHGADLVGLNPLHALFLDQPELASPYSPASRLLLNALNIDIADLPELAHAPDARALIDAPAFQDRLRVCRAATLVAYDSVAALKLPVLRALFAARHAPPIAARLRQFEAFRAARGAVLQSSCLFLALRDHFLAQGGSGNWRDWPTAWRDPASPEVAAFAATRAEAVTFQAWLQFLADTQLAAAAEAARDMAIGLYRDLAVGVDSAGAETWTNQRAVARGARVGAPPDIHNPAGQDWGLPPFHPEGLRQDAYRGFIDLVRENMRHAGALRIDHVMALKQLYWVPEGQDPTQGAFVRYPIEDLVGILALESQRNRCLVVGEDLGTVPEGFRARMEEARVLSYRVLFFEQDEHGFLPPASYPRLSIAVAGSHDLPTLHGWWGGRDIALKEQLALYPAPEDAAQARTQREQDRTHLVRALACEGLIDADKPLDPPHLIDAAHAWLARSSAAIAMIQIDDATHEPDQVNVPATSTQHPNWRRRLSLTLEEMSTDQRFTSLTKLLGDARPSAQRN